MKSKLRLKEEKKENWRLQAGGIAVGVVLVILMQILSELFETHAFFGMSIMLLSLLVVNLSYLVELKIKEQVEKEKGKSSLKTTDRPRPSYNSEG
ncbi:MAG: hypothetical protein ONB44_15475 [candidate division KSB1 bacterium]|nr:hypothetical protein [candidate division KSB1 bacterium]MDZ7303531.1 hypothetical protein [candidate division KSB1 bacterium]